MNNKLSIKRLKAFLIDYVIILIYIGFLFGITVFIFSLLKMEPGNINPALGQLTGFISLISSGYLIFQLEGKWEVRRYNREKKNEVTCSEQ